MSAQPAIELRRGRSSHCSNAAAGRVSTADVKRLINIGLALAVAKSALDGYLLGASSPTIYDRFHRHCGPGCRKTFYFEAPVTASNIE